MATAVYEWKQNAPKLPGVDGGAPKNPTDPMGAPTQGQSSTSMFGTTSQNRQAAGGTPSFGDLVKSPTGGGPTPSFNDLFQGVGEQRQQNVQAATQNIAQGFQPQGESIATTQARNQFQKTQDEAQRQVLEQSALAGRGQTGQIVGDNRNFMTQAALPQAMDFEALLQTNEQNLNRQRSQDAFGNLLNLEGLGESSRNAAAQNALTARGQDITMRGQDIQERTSQAQLSQADRALAENARQFNTRQEFETWATEQGWNQDAIARAWQSQEAALERGSREGIAFAGLSLEEKRLAQEGSQFKSKQDFDRWALEKGLDNEAAGRIWQSLENSKAQASTEKIAFAQLSVREKELAQAGQQFKDELSFKKYATEGGWSQQEADRAWQSLEAEKDRSLTTSESALDRELEQYLTEAGLDIDRQQLTESIRQFDSKLSFDQWATQAGLDDNEKDRVWQANLQDLDRKWQTGERLGSQEHQVLIEDKRAQAQQAAQEFERVTNLEAMGLTQNWEREKIGLTQNYETLRANQQMSHEQAMQVMRGEIERGLTAMGIDADAARQAADIEARKWDTERQLAHQTTLSNAELAYKYESLREQMGLSREELNLKSAALAQEADQFLKTFGLEEQKVNAMLESQEMKDAIGMATTFLELAGDNPDMVQFASEHFLKALGGMKNPDGTPVISPQEIDGMLQQLSQPAPAGEANEYRTDDALGRIGRGIGQIASGDFLEGAGNTLGGQVDFVVGAGSDAVKGVTSGAKKVAGWVGSLF